ncbi:HDOD domain-containing protein [Psychromonas sp.]|nr:HDOD domain-containing protein [Psychromonas sp.]
MSNKPALSSSDINKLFLRFLVGKSKVYKEEDYNDGLNELGESDQEQDEAIEAKGNGWNQRILLEVEQERKTRVLEAKKEQDKRNAILTRYFQQLLLSTIDEKLKDTDSVVAEQLQMRDNSIELLILLLAKEPRYSILAGLLDLNPSTRNHVIGLVSSEDFMSLLGREKRIVSDIQTAVGMIGTDVLRYLIPALLFKYRINAFNQHNRLFARKLWRYQLTLGQVCTSLMKEIGYRRPYEGLILSAMLNFAYTASYQQYLESFEAVRTRCIAEAREKGEKQKHDFFYEISSDPASLQALLLSKSDLKMSVRLASQLFQKDFPHLLNALNEEVENVAFESRSKVGKILFQAIHFAKYDQLRSSRLFKREWLDDYLVLAHIDVETFKNLSRQELFRFKPNW